MRGAWVVPEPSLDSARVRLFCVPHAGGGGVMFRPWRDLLGSEVEACSIVLPGRESRIHELPYVRMEQLVGPLFEQLRPHLDRPFALFGHSMGAVVAYELARRCQLEGAPAPVRLFVSARRAPHLPARRPSYADLSDDEFLTAVAAMNGTPAEVLAQRDLLKIFLPGLRGDFELNDTYVPLPGPRLTCPISASVGDADPEADLPEILAWSQVTTGGFRSRVFPGDHFYLKTDPAALLRAICDDLGVRSGSAAGGELVPSPPPRG
ncbi:thioesterase II family protein [Catellatospora vulcania]|uniref:thioesterase II family protein n=1 Tax=Catellatospora vulcania TaxID=1460450 RepID=UPI0012D37FF5|nr:alpha/beta fold hydrolase [Catellatospora vulcania]